MLDVDRNVRSYQFQIADQVYRNVLKQAVRMLFYQRAGQAKDAARAGAGWTDAASFAGALQDQHCRLFSDKNNAATERDLRGGWYDAGDLNKYTSWTAGYVETLLRAYAESPTVWTDDYNIPESGNGIPDVLDEAKWGLDFLVRMQSTDGVGAQHRGRAVGQPAVGGDRPEPVRAGEHVGDAGHRGRVRGRRAHPEAAGQRRAEHVRRRSADARAQRLDVGGREPERAVQEQRRARTGRPGSAPASRRPTTTGASSTSWTRRRSFSPRPATPTYRTFFDASYAQLHLITYSNYVAPWDVPGQDAALDYADATGATAATVSAIRDAYLTGAKGSGNLGAITGNRDPYLAFMSDYVWGSNSTKSQVGNLFAAVVSHRLEAASNADMTRAASRYVHYLHGTNPLSLVYLTNMYAYGAESCANEMFHTWFADGSAMWDRAGTSTYGPPPGYLTGGPNPGYDWDACCPSSCGGTANNAVCTSTPITPPKGQPAQKAYKDFNTAWPLNSWSVTEPSDGYQVAYIRLLSKLVR